MANFPDRAATSRWRRLAVLTGALGAVALVLLLASPKTAHLESKPGTDHATRHTDEAPMLVGAPVSDRAQPVPGSPKPPPPALAPNQVLHCFGRVEDEWGKRVAEGAVQVARGQGQARHVVAEAPVSPEGRFALDVPREQSSSLEIRFHGKGSRSGSIPLDLTPAMSGAEVVLIAYRFASVAVSVVDSNGASVADARIESVPDGLIVGDAITDASGSAAVTLEADPYAALRAVGPDGTRGETRALYIQPGATRNVRVSLAGKWRRVPVRLVSLPSVGQGEPLQATVYFLEGANAAVTLALDGPSKDLTLPPDRAVRAQVHAVGHPIREIFWPGLNDALDGSGVLSVPWRRVVDLRLQVVGPASDAASLLPIEVIEVRALGSAPTASRHITDTDGVVRFNGLPEGAYRVRTAGKEIGVVHATADSPSQKVVLEASSRLHGTYVGPARIGWRGAALRVSLDAATSWDIPVSSAVRDTSWDIALPLAPGTQVLVGVVAGNLELVPARVAHTGSVPVSLNSITRPIEIRVRAGDRRHVRGWIQLRPANAPTRATRSMVIGPLESSLWLLAPLPGAYAVYYSEEMLGRNGRLLPTLLVMSADAEAYEVDTGPD